MKKSRVIVGMSGGVDSSVSAWLLKEQGYDVIGLFMKNWEETDEMGVCHASKDYDDVAAICRQIQIPYYSINLVEEYREAVFGPFLADCRAGLTPNPDVLCNREIKFKAFMNKALEFDAEMIATGHYCQVRHKEGYSYLLKGSDPNKDQSYFLHAVTEKALSRTIFPVGHLPKSEVRSIARKQNLATAEKKDSTGICFIGERRFKQFLGQFIGYQKGPIQTLDGQEVGEHDGIAYYTIGQRKGLGLGGDGEAWFVVKKNPATNTLFVVRGKNHPALFCQELVADSLSWINEPPQSTFDCTAKIRYRQQDTPCSLQPIDAQSIRVIFQNPQRAVTPGQFIVFYDGDVVLGGGVIR
jgi:tRNA-specific 2-thiouridylase